MSDNTLTSPISKFLDRDHEVAHFSFRLGKPKPIRVLSLILTLDSFSSDVPLVDVVVLWNGQFRGPDFRLTVDDSVQYVNWTVGEWYPVESVDLRLIGVLAFSEWVSVSGRIVISSETFFETRWELGDIVVLADRNLHLHLPCGIQFLEVEFDLSGTLGFIAIVKNGKTVVESVVDASKRQYLAFADSFEMERLDCFEIYLQKNLDQIMINGSASIGVNFGVPRIPDESSLKNQLGDLKHICLGPESSVVIWIPENASRSEVMESIWWSASAALQMEVMSLRWPGTPICRAALPEQFLHPVFVSGNCSVGRMGKGMGAPYGLRLTNPDVGSFVCSEMVLLKWILEKDVLTFTYDVNVSGELLEGDQTVWRHFALPYTRNVEWVLNSSDALQSSLWSIDRTSGRETQMWSGECSPRQTKRLHFAVSESPIDELAFRPRDNVNMLFRARIRFTVVALENGRQEHTPLTVGELVIVILAGIFLLVLFATCCVCFVLLVGFAREKCHPGDYDRYDSDGYTAIE